MDRFEHSRRKSGELIDQSRRIVRESRLLRAEASLVRAKAAELRHRRDVFLKDLWVARPADQNAAA